MSAAKKPPAIVYVLRLRARPGVDAVRELRWILKRLLRSHGFRCLSATEETNDKGAQ
jgi:hypothetical protein